MAKLDARPEPVEGTTSASRTSATARPRSTPEGGEDAVADPVGGDGAVARIGAIVEGLEWLRDEMRRRFEEVAPTIERVHPRHRPSAANLIDYLTLRSYDLREVQESLAELGLSSLGRAEEHVITTLERVIANLHVLAGDGTRHRTEGAVGFHRGRETLVANGTALLGPSRPARPVRILVTLPSEAAADADLVDHLVESGMDCARINCAHDGPAQWLAMIDHVRRAAGAAGRTCPVVMDLPGPRLRTGPLEPGPRVVRIRPRRDDLGRVREPARAQLVADEQFDSPRGATRDVTAIPVPLAWLSALTTGDVIHLEDARGARRRAEVDGVTPAGRSLRFFDTTYICTGTVLEAKAAGVTVVGDLPEVDLALRLFRGDVLTVTSDESPVCVPGTRIGCTLGGALDSVRVGERVFFDDGRIGGRVIRRRPGEIDVEITAAATGGSKLRAEKGINLPDTSLHLPALTDDDVETLRFVAEHADVVGLSFVNGPDDVDLLRENLAALDALDVGIVLKIETLRGFERLPEVLLAAMASPRVGVMVARGDLAVECGFERLAEVQEEILWLCESAHVPVIWATQVLDQMARTGQPSRAEISDAAMAGRAECVMLNKGPYVIEAVSALDDILRRMDSLQHKKTALLRRLTSWSPVVDG